MFNPKFEVIRFQAEDVIATSIRWSAKSYQADTHCSVNDGAVLTSYPEFDGLANVVDGEVSNDKLGNDLTIGNWYHYDTNTFVAFDGSTASANWKTCTDASHYYNGN